MDSMTKDIALDASIPAVRARIYALLAEGFAFPDEEHAAYLKAGYLSAWEELLGLVEEEVGLSAPVDRMKARLRRVNVGSLQEEYVELFEPQGRMAAPPYEGEYTRYTPQHDLLLSAQLADVAGFYRAFGVEPSQSCPDRPDHVATELEFMHLLAAKEAVAASDAQEEHFTVTREAQRKFLGDHLGKWTGPFRERVGRSREDSPYAALADAVDRWVRYDSALLGMDA